MESVVASGRVQVTTDATAALRDSEVSFVCVGTPSRPNGTQDLSALERLCAELGAALRAKAADHVSWSVPTASWHRRGDGGALIERDSGHTRGRDFDVCSQPEFLREGSSHSRLRQPLVHRRRRRLLARRKP